MGMKKMLAWDIIMIICSSLDHTCHPAAASPPLSPASAPEGDTWLAETAFD